MEDVIVPADPTSVAVFSPLVTCVAGEPIPGFRESVSRFSGARGTKRSFTVVSLDGSHTLLETDFFDRFRPADDADKNETDDFFPPSTKERKRTTMSASSDFAIRLLIRGTRKKCTYISYESSGARNKFSFTSDDSFFFFFFCNGTSLILLFPSF